MGLLENAVPVGWKTNVTSANDLMFSSFQIRNEERRLTAQFCPGSVDILGTHQATASSAKLVCRGRGRDDLVTLEWTDAGIRQSAQFPASDATEMPPIPDNLSTIDPQFLSAMTDAVANPVVRAYVILTHFLLYLHLLVHVVTPRLHRSLRKAVDTTPMNELASVSR